jgi:hypothetical protein
MTTLARMPLARSTAEASAPPLVPCSLGTRQKECQR